ncbi:MAG: PfkB family carbohydrate kinase [Trebonia sp.]
MTRVVVFGSINADLIFAVETLPTPGQTLLASARLVEPGGKGANPAVAAALHAGLGVTVIRTLGGAGVEWTGRGGHGRVTAAPIHAADTTATGDCFVGVPAAAWTDGVSLHDAIHRANVAAGLACTRHGSHGSLPGSTEISRSIQEETTPWRKPSRASSPS